MDVEVKKWNYNPESAKLEIIVEQGEGKEPLTISISETTLHSIMSAVPAFQEEAKIQELLKKIYEIRERRIMVVEEIDKKLEDLRKEHKDVRSRLVKTGIGKLEIMALASETKDLAAEKVLLDTKRHLIRLLAVEESDLRARLAKAMVGRLKQ
jgi:hypothetical protein